MDNNTDDIKKNANSLEQIEEAINNVEEHIIRLKAQNEKAEHQIAYAVEKRNAEITDRNNKAGNIRMMLNKLMKYGMLKQHVARMVEEKVQRSIRMSEFQKGSAVEVPALHYNFIYQINNPTYFPTLSQMVTQMEESSSRERPKREDEIRTLKIRISLAQIQLKELKNRSKKV